MAESRRLSRTTRHISSSRFSDGELYIRGPEPDPTFVPRLTWSIPALEKLDYNSAELCDTIARATDVAYYCDNSIFHDNAPRELWDSLFDNTAAVFLTPRIEAELLPWLDVRLAHPVNKALEAGRLDVRTAADWPEPEQQAFVHYVNILSLRKSMMSWGDAQFERKHGRAPEASDSRAVQAMVQSAVGERGYLFARKGRDERAKGVRSFADEELVYTAVADALRTGRQTIILTRDEDLLDQFYRLLYLIDTHYRSMHIARAYLDDIGSFRLHPMPDRDEWADAFIPASSTLVELHPDLPNRVLPSSFHFVAVSCVLVGERYQQMTFGAETEMKEVLGVKGRTRGRNTDVLGDRNCHLSLAGLPSPGKHIPLCFAVAQDRTLRVAGQDIPVLEMNHALISNERFKVTKYSPLIVPPSRNVGT